MIPLNVFDYLNDKVNIFLSWHQRKKRREKFVIQHLHFKQGAKSPSGRETERDGKNIVFFEVRQVDGGDGRMRNVWAEIMFVYDGGGNLICRVACFSDRDRNRKVSSKIFVILQSN